jgi:superfamily I DNA/RNA helicase
MVSLVQSFETAEILAAVGRMVPESRADLVISTAHKAKGREWPTVQIASDFSKLKPENKPGLRLQYVAVTRAQDRLDMTALQKDREND